jgi:hypothetical protein
VECLARTELKAPEISYLSTTAKFDARVETELQKRLLVSSDEKDA